MRTRPDHRLCRPVRGTDEAEPDQNDWRGSNNGTYRYRGGNPRGDAPSDTKDKDNEQKDANDESGNKS